MSRSSYAQWYANLPIPWLVGGPNGQAEAQTWPAVLDAEAVLLDAARKVAFPDYTPTDALPNLGGDRKLIQGPGEAATSFRTRCRDAMNEWSRAGTACGVLEQLAYFAQSNSLVWVQQNGLQFALSAMPTPGVDPTPLVVATTLSPLSSVLTSTVAPYRTIPVGTPWFAFDGNTDLCNRFAIIFTSWPFSTIVSANFAGTDSATLTWPVGFASASYSVLYGTPSAPVTLYVDGTTQTASGVTLRASGAWYGSVPVIAYATGVNPLNFFSSSSFGAMKSLIAAFRPNTLCMGVFVLVAGRMWDYPAGVTWDGSGLNWDSSVSYQLLGAF